VQCFTENCELNSRLFKEFRHVAYTISDETKHWRFVRFEIMGLKTGFFQKIRFFSATEATDSKLTMH
jgi:hypothetical protein